LRYNYSELNVDISDLEGTGVVHVQRLGRIIGEGNVVNGRQWIENIHSHTGAINTGDDTQQDNSETQSINQPQANIQIYQIIT
jgi:hypothetical protein